MATRITKRWVRLAFKKSETQGHIKTHWLSPSLVRDVLANLRSRYGAVLDLEIEKQLDPSGQVACIDYGGSLFGDDVIINVDLSTGQFTKTQVKLDGTLTAPIGSGRNLEVLAHHVSGVLHELEAAPTRGRSMSWIKLHGRYGCVVLTLNEARRFHSALCRALPDPCSEVEAAQGKRLAFVRSRSDLFAQPDEVAAARDSAKKARKESN